MPIDERAANMIRHLRSGPGGARIHVCGLSGRRYAVSATGPLKQRGPAFFDTGPSHSAGIVMKGQASTAIGIERERTRQTFGETLRILATYVQWPTLGVHRNLWRA
jgi:hypothetical protein